MIRAYAHCARDTVSLLYLSESLFHWFSDLINIYLSFHWQQGITLVLINLSGNSTTQVFLTTQTSYSSPIKLHQRKNHRTRIYHLPKLGKTLEFTREEYHLTSKDGDIHSQTMLLNGNILSVDSNGNIPELEPVKVDATEPIRVEPFSIVFVRIAYIQAQACR